MSFITNRLADAVAGAFEFLSGDSSTAIRKAQGHSYKSWVRRQLAQASAAGAAAGLIPALHVPALVGDLAFLFHKMAHCSWGIGQIQDCVVLGKADFMNILALWSGASTLDELPFRAISKAAFSAAAVGGTFMIDQISLESIFASEVGGHVEAQVAEMIGAAGMMDIAARLAAHGHATASLGSAALAGKKIASKVAAKVAAKIGSKLGAKCVLGFLPLVGAAACASINAYFIASIATAAQTYYSERKESQNRIGVDNKMTEQ